MLQRVKVNGSRLKAWAFTRIVQHRLSPIPQRSVDEVISPRFFFLSPLQSLGLLNNFVIT